MYVTWRVTLRTSTVSSYFQLSWLHSKEPKERLCVSVWESSRPFTYENSGAYNITMKVRVPVFQPLYIHLTCMSKICSIYIRFTTFSHHSLTWLCFIFLILPKICMKVFTDTTREIFGTPKHFCANKTFQSCCFTFIHLIILHFHAKTIIIFTLTPAASPVCVYVCSICLIFIIRWVSLGCKLLFITRESQLHVLSAGNCAAAAAA